jgi:hypothetical protein
MDLKRLYNIGKTHVVDTTAMLASTNPIFAFFENVALGMSDEVSTKARLAAATLAYTGLATAVTRGRDLSQKLFKITPESSERKQYVHDTGFLIVLNAIIAPVMYKVAGAEGSEILKGTGAAMGLSFVNGYIIGYAIDAFRDLTGIKKSSRIPKKIQNLSSRAKLGLAGLSLAALVGINAGVYELTPDKVEETKNDRGYSIENVIENVE